MQKTSLRKFIATLLVATLFCNIVSISAFAADPSATFSSDDLKTYNQELFDLGLSKAAVKQLQDITTKIANAKTMREVDILMTDYHRIIETTPLAAAKSFPSTSGGTLKLEYTGKLSPVSNVIFTKVVYMSNKQVEFYLTAINNSTLLSFITDQLIGKGVTIITKSVAAQIAALLSIPETAVSFLVGTSVSGLLFVCQNLEKWDLNDAIKRSSNGKVKLEYFYSTNTVAPYYQEHQNFEPWDNNLIEIPKDYNYKWQSDVYECEHLSK